MQTVDRIRKSIAPAALTIVAMGATQAQQDWSQCFDPTNMMPISLDWSVPTVGNQMIIGGVGLSGNVTWGPESPCGIPPGNDAQNAVGYLMIHTGSVGNSFTGEDNLVGISMGAPYAGNNWSFATIRVIDGDGGVSDTKWAENGFSEYLAPTASFRRIRATAAAEGGVSAQLEMRVIGNAIRYAWTLTNQNATPVQIGLRHATWVAFLNQGQGPLPLGGASGWSTNAYVYLPSGRPQLIERRFTRAADPLGFPKFLDLYYRQTRFAPAIRFVMAPDEAHPDQTQADQLDISNFTGGMGGSLWNFGITDDRPLGQSACGIFYNPTFVAPGASRQIVYYIELPFKGSNLAVTPSGGYAIANDSPPMIAWNSGINALSPNPFNIVCWVDNQYAWVLGSETMTDIQLTLTLPSGLNFNVGETALKTIASLGPNGTTSRQWSVVADGNRPGIYTYTIQCAPGPAAQLPFAPKTITGQIIVAASPRQNFVTGPNLITNPWVLANPNMATTTGLNNPGDFVAWNWDVLTQSYQPTNTFTRGRGQWLVMNSDFPGTAYAGASSSGQDVPGGFAFTIRRGWNLIGNPYLYSVQLNQLNAISSFNPSEVLLWSDLTQRGWVRSVVFSWDTALAEYKFSSDPTQLIPPHTGYWVYVNTESTITLLWPPIFLPGLPGSPRASNEWAIPTDSKWRLQFTLRGEGSSDSSNYLGVAPNAGEAARLSAPKPPTAPSAKVRMAFVREPNGDDPISWAQDIRDGAGRKVFKLQATVDEPGTYTISWPNIAQVPSSLRGRITDLSNNQSRDLRMASSYTFTASEASSRMFEVVIEPGTASKAVIGSVMVSGSSRDPQAPISIQYTLSTNATVTTRILSTTGKEVMTMTRGRAEGSGVNTVVWNKRMSDGTAVAPGNYMVEIVAETADGQRVRVTRPVVVTR